jgi:RNA polymerase sigma factor (sigma-70 family)
MHTSDDMRLLEEYARDRSEQAFSTLVSRNLNLVYSAAMRSVNNSHQAEEITQAVFLMLARKAASLRPDTLLSGWLYQTARLTAANYVRAESRRQRREQRFQSDMNTSDPPEAWTRVGPLLEEAMAHLNESDRDAIVLRFFQGKAFKEVGDALGVNEDAAKMRVSRALDKLREFFVRRGITMSAGALALALAENSIQAAPGGLAASVVSAAAGVAQSSALAVSGTTMMKGVLHMMSSAKVSLVIGLGAAAVVGMQWRQNYTQEQTLRQLEAQVALQTLSNRTDQAEIARLRELNASYVKTMDSMSRDAVKSRANARSAQDANQRAEAAMKRAAKAGENSMDKMFSNPDWLKAMRPTQLMTVKAQLGPLVKRLGLSPEQADKFYDTIVDSGIKAVQAISAGNTNGIDPHSLSQSLRSLLGDAGFAQYNEYLKNEMYGQTMFSAMKSYFDDNPLTDQQQQQLVQALNAAKKSIVPDSPGTTSGDAALEMTPQQRMEQINQVVLQQAAGFLSPAQVQNLGAFQSNMLAQQQANLPVRNKMFLVSPVANEK